MFQRSLLAVVGLAALAAIAVGAIVLRGEGRGGGPSEALPFDSARMSFDENLKVKEEAGEWTRGEGLVATLKLFQGEAAAGDVLRYGEVLERSGTGILALGYEYLESGEDAAAKAEIQRLLDDRIFEPDELQAMAGGNFAVLPRGLLARPNLDATLCEQYFEGYNVNVGATPCVLYMTFSAGGQTHRLWRPVDGIFEHPWTEKHYSLAIQAVQDAANLYAGYGKVPPMNVVFYVSEASGVLAEAAAHTGSQCGIGVMTSLLAEEDKHFKFHLAHEVAHCFQEENFEQAPYFARRWREEGLADHLANLVYPSSQTEWGRLPELTAREYDTTLLERSYDNFIWWQFVKNEVGVKGMFGLIDHIGDASDQRALLETYPGIGALYHKFQQQFTDASVMDESGVPIPNTKTGPIREVTGPMSPVVKEPVKGFGVRRLILTVEDGKQAAFDFDLGEDVSFSARRLTGQGQWQDWLAAVPEGDGCDGERTYVLVVTTFRSEGEWELHAPSVEEPECDTDFEPPVAGRDKCLIGDWLMDNEILHAYLQGEDPPTFHTTAVEGAVFASYRADGIATFMWQDASVSWSMDEKDARGRPMDIGGSNIFNGTASKPWAADGKWLQYEPGQADVRWQTNTHINERQTEGEWRDASQMFGGVAAATPQAGGAPAPGPGPQQVSGGWQPGVATAYKCQGNRLEIPASNGYTYVWDRIGG